MVMMNRKIALLGLSIATSAMLLGSCSTIQSMSNTQKGAATGAVAGGALGAIIGNKAGNTAVGVLAGAAIGGVAGGLIGKKMDRQAAEIERTVAGAEVIKADEGIIVKFDSGILFDFDKTEVKPAARENIGKLVASLNGEPNTDILVVGHTDNKGTDSYNQGLSERRAKAVRDYAVSQGLATRRIKTEGRSFHEPIGDNNTDAGRAENRRVEIVIVANDQMKEEALREAGN
ncbi:Outer membrane protein OmpA [Parapedobacter koreensis]|uniref:Outer membrane protein OmpA n=2 Tax=Parapedobacter koreensis TaxID=332977 RepID=A0A1H7SLA8_9SPHI|nr:Outer membrane protein OmpA [Parapedobacter koreensis]